MTDHFPHTSRDPGSTVSRRSLLRSSAFAAGVLGAVGGVGGAAPAGSVSRPTRRRGVPRNVILVVSDGMSAAVPGLTEAFAGLVRPGRPTRLPRLLADRNVADGMLETRSLDSPVTDSAAASSAWASGFHVANGSINHLPDGTRLVPIGTLLRDAGMGVGLVSTTRVTHATPAAFATASPSRNFEDAIAEQLIGAGGADAGGFGAGDSGVDVLLGGGRRFFDPATRGDRVDWIARSREAGYEVLGSKADLAKASGPRLLGLFSESHLPMTIDRRRDAGLDATVPTLAEMTTAALRTLAAHPGGFLLQVEGGRVDHAAHANDAAGLLWDQLELDDALATVLDFAAAREDTLVVFTTDHANANPGLSGTGRRYGRSGEVFANVAAATASVEATLPRLSRAEAEGGEAAVAAVVAETFGCEADGRSLRPLRQALRREPIDETNPQLANAEGQLGRLLSGHTGIAFVGTSHTADWVPMVATGPGQERFEGFMDHPQVFERLADLFGITHRNPTAGSPAT